MIPRPPFGAARGRRILAALVFILALPAGSEPSRSSPLTAPGRAAVEAITQQRPELLQPLVSQMLSLIQNPLAALQAATRLAPKKMTGTEVDQHIEAARIALGLIRRPEELARLASFASPNKGLELPTLGLPDQEEPVDFDVVVRRFIGAVGTLRNAAGRDPAVAEPLSRADEVLASIRRGDSAESAAVIEKLFDGRENGVVDAVDASVARAQPPLHETDRAGEARPAPRPAVSEIPEPTRPALDSPGRAAVEALVGLRPRLQTALTSFMMDFIEQPLTALRDLGGFSTQKRTTTAMDDVADAARIVVSLVVQPEELAFLSSLLLEEPSMKPRQVNLRGRPIELRNFVRVFLTKVAMLRETAPRHPRIADALSHAEELRASFRRDDREEAEDMVDRILSREPDIETAQDAEPEADPAESSSKADRAIWDEDNADAFRHAGRAAVEAFSGLRPGLAAPLLGHMANLGAYPTPRALNALMRIAGTECEASNQPYVEAARVAIALLWNPDELAHLASYLGAGRERLSPGESAVDMGGGTWLRAPLYQALKPFIAAARSIRALALTDDAMAEELSRLDALVAALRETLPSESPRPLAARPASSADIQAYRKLAKTSRPN